MSIKQPNQEPVAVSKVDSDKKTTGSDSNVGSAKPDNKPGKDVSSTNSPSGIKSDSKSKPKGSSDKASNNLGKGDKSGGVGSAANNAAGAANIAGQLAAVKSKAEQKTAEDPNSSLAENYAKEGGKAAAKGAGTALAKKAKAGMMSKLILVLKKMAAKLAALMAKAAKVAAVAVGKIIKAMPLVAKAAKAISKSIVGKAVGKAMKALAGIIKGMLVKAGLTALAAGAKVVAVVVAVIVVIAFIVGLVVLLVWFLTPQRDDYIIELDDCVAIVDSIRDGIEYDPEPDGMQLYNAQQINSVLRSLDFSDDHIAAVLGTFQHESGLDPTRIEAIHPARWVVTDPDIQAAIADLHAHAINVVFPNTNISIDRNAYRGPDGRYYPGIGLVQFTGPRAYRLFHLAEDMGRNWWELDAQLAVMIAREGGDSVFFSETFPNQTFNGLEATTFGFVDGFVRNPPSRAPSYTHAAVWRVLLSEWYINASFANSVLELAQVTGANANDNMMRSALADCAPARGNHNVDNSTIARAAATLAWPDQRIEGTNMHHVGGTPLFQQVRRGILYDGIWLACCRVAMVPIRWSGADESFPPGNVQAQLDYMTNSSKWTEISWRGEFENLLPGDVLINRHSASHIGIWVGPEDAYAIHGDNLAPNAYIYDGSLHTRAANMVGVNSWWQSFRAFRLIEPDNGSTYSHLGLGTPPSTD